MRSCILYRQLRVSILTKCQKADSSSVPISESTRHFTFKTQHLATRWGGEGNHLCSSCVQKSLITTTPPPFTWLFFLSSLEFLHQSHISISQDCLISQTLEHNSEAHIPFTQGSACLPPTYTRHSPKKM